MPNVASPPLVVQWDNHDNDPDDRPNVKDTALWARVQIILGDVILAAFGNKRTFRRRGVLLVSIFSKLTIGTKKAVAVAGVIESKFRAQTAAGVLYEMPRFQHIGRTGARFQSEILCPFTADDSET